MPVYTKKNVCMHGERARQRERERESLKKDWKSECLKSAPESVLMALFIAFRSSNGFCSGDANLPGLHEGGP